MGDYSVEKATKRLTEVTPAEWDALRETMQTNGTVMPINEVEAVDLVNKPPHYNHGKIEAIDYLKDSLGENVSYYYEGSVKKYLHRWRYKNDTDADLQKQDLMVELH